MTRLWAIMVFSMEPVGTSLLAMTKVVSTKAMTAADTNTWIQLMSSAFQPVFGSFFFRLLFWSNSLFSFSILINLVNS